jgi:polyphosphate kinase
MSSDMTNEPSASDVASSPVFFNRELSWVEFNERVLKEGLRKDIPPLERFRYLSIVSSNFNEFFMVRVAAIKRANEEADPSGFSPPELLERINKRVRSIMTRQYSVLVNDVFPDLAKGGLSILRPSEWSPSQRNYLESIFAREVFPLLTPLRVEEDDPLPSIENYSIYTAFLLKEETASSEAASSEKLSAEAAPTELASDEIPAREHISIIRIPQAPDRIVPIPPGETEIHDDSEMGQTCFALLEDLVESYGIFLYPGYSITESLIFMVNRDADFSVDEQRDEDFIEAMVEVLEGRGRSMPVRMIYSPGSKKIRDHLARRLSLKEDDLFEAAGPLNLEKLYDLIRGFEHLREKPWKIYSHPAFSEDQSLWDRISQEDLLLHMPYQSFDPVVRFFQEAAADPAVAAIKTTLYRTSGDSPIVRALEQASLAGKHVTAVVELKARFDEGRNISWANRLEKAGVIVVYGLARLKIHAKVTVVMRREYDRIKRYVHLSTGNYNDKTAKLYEDISLFTAREDIAFDAGLLFNMITGYSVYQPMGRLAIAPTALKRKFLELIAREMSRSTPESPGRIMAKMNALADQDIIKALYRASQAGVKVFLNVRGVCMLVPGVKGLSDNIRVVSVIDHYLEHSRIYYFANGGAEEVYLSSADLMTRNLERRVELMFPILQDSLRKAVFEILSVYFRDNNNAWLLDSEGVWTRIEPAAGEKAFRAQAYFLSRAAQLNTEEHPVRGDFIVRRSPPSKE